MVQEAFDTWYGGKNNTITVDSLKRMPHTQKLVKGISGPIMTYEPW